MRVWVPRVNPLQLSAAFDHSDSVFFSLFSVVFSFRRHALACYVSNNAIESSRLSIFVRQTKDWRQTMRLTFKNSPHRKTKIPKRHTKLTNDWHFSVFPLFLRTHFKCWRNIINEKYANSSAREEEKANRKPKQLEFVVWRRRKSVNVKWDCERERRSFVNNEMKYCSIVWRIGPIENSISDYKTEPNRRPTEWKGFFLFSRRVAIDNVKLAEMKNSDFINAEQNEIKMHWICNERRGKNPFHSHEKTQQIANVDMARPLCFLSHCKYHFFVWLFSLSSLSLVLAIIVYSLARRQIRRFRITFAACVSALVQTSLTRDQVAHTANRVKWMDIFRVTKNEWKKWKRECKIYNANIWKSHRLYAVRQCCKMHLGTLPTLSVKCMREKRNENRTIFKHFFWLWNEARPLITDMLFNAT